MPATESRSNLNQAGFLGVQVKLEDGKVVVVMAIEDSPAEKAGFKPGDIIEKIGDLTPTTLPEFSAEVGKNKPGTKVTLVVTRDGKEMKITATLGKKPDSLGM